MRIGVLTSGGDAPGMNAAIRSVTKVGLARGHVVIGIERGYEGLLEGAARPLSLIDVDGISRFGGTMLGSARSSVFPTDDGQRLARTRVRELALDAIIVIGGNGSLAGAHALGSDGTVRILGIPASIDNDVGHTGLAIGVDTAVNTIVEACDRISDTAGAHRRAFIVEVMGRQCGYLAMRAGIASEADAILFAERARPEDEMVEQLSRLLEKSFADVRKKRRVLIIKAEGVAVGTHVLTERLQRHLDAHVPGVGIRETILGHVVRGGAPSATDRVIAQRLALASVLAVEAGLHDEMCAWEPPGAVGTKTDDPSVRRVPIVDVLTETERMITGTSEVVRRRVKLLEQVEGILAL
jgi:6-phosphofructokinase 1